MHLGYFSVLEPDCRKLVETKLWMVVQHKDDPFYFITSTGLIVAPVHKEKTDLGSIPPILHWVCDKDRYLPAFLAHDDLYFRRYALRPKFPYIPGDDNLKELMGRFVMEEDELVRLQLARLDFDVVRIDRPMADYILSEAIFTYKPDETIRRMIVYRAVRTFGFVPWMRKGDKRDESLRSDWATKLTNRTDCA